VFGQHPFRAFVCLVVIGVVTFVAYRIIPVNATTVGFAYLLLILVIASFMPNPGVFVDRPVSS
jgi:hypothetical protein